MRHAYGTVVLVIGVSFCLVTTWSSGATPDNFAARLGLRIADPGGANEIRAQYAGFFLAVGIVCAASLAGMLSRQASYVVLGTVFGGLILGRLASLAVDGGVSGYSPTIRALYVVDAVGFAMSAAALVLDGPASG